MIKVYCPCGCGEYYSEVALIKNGIGYYCPCSECKKEIAGEEEKEDIFES